MHKKIITYSALFSLACSSFGYGHCQKEPHSLFRDVMISYLKITYQYSDLKKDIIITIPAAAEGTEVKRIAKLVKVIQVDKNGAIMMDKKTFTAKELEAELKKLVKQNKDQAIRIRGKATTEYDDIVRVIDRCRIAGIWNISFATEVPKK